MRAVLDWELATLGNPWSDVAYMCLAYHMPPALASMRLARPLPPGVPDEAALLGRYCAAAGVSPPPPGEWAFYLALSLFRLLAILAGVQVGLGQGRKREGGFANVGESADGGGGPACKASLDGLAALQLQCHSEVPPCPQPRAHGRRAPSRATRRRALPR